MTQTLEQQLSEIVAKHGLLNVSITATVGNDGVGGVVKFYASAQSPKDDGDRWCAGNEGWTDSVTDAIGGAISQLNVRRYPTEVPALAPMGEAA